MTSSACELKPQRLVQGLINRTGLAWSPDGKWLAFDGEYGDHGRGVWVTNMSGKVTRILAGDYRRPHWSPDGNTIVVSGPDLDNESVRLDQYRSIYTVRVADLRTIGP